MVHCGPPTLPPITERVKRKKNLLLSLSSTNFSQIMYYCLPMSGLEIFKKIHLQYSLPHWVLVFSKDYSSSWVTTDNKKKIIFFIDLFTWFVLRIFMEFKKNKMSLVYYFSSRFFDWLKKCLNKIWNSFSNPVNTYLIKISKFHLIIFKY